MRNIKSSEIYDQHYRAVYFYALSLTHNEEEAKDLTQEIFVKALLSTETRTHPNFRAWLLRVCRNHWIDECRRNKFVISDEKNLQHVHANEAKLPLERLLHSEKNRALYLAMQQLPDHIRDCFIMHYFSDVPQHQIASILGISQGAVRTLFYRGRLLLKKLMEEKNNVLFQRDCASLPTRRSNGRGNCIR
ncbi:MAG: RNA polymerase sigma factor [Bacilli bacterium]